MHYRDLPALVHEQEIRNLTLHLSAPRVVLNFLFLVRELVLENPDNALQKCCNPYNYGKVANPSPPPPHPTKGHE